jgi:hypothetical protein
MVSWAKVRRDNVEAEQLGGQYDVQKFQEHHLRYRWYCQEPHTAYPNM